MSKRNVKAPTVQNPHLGTKRGKEEEKREEGNKEKKERKNLKREEETNGSVGSKPVWSTLLVPSQLGLHCESLSKGKKENQARKVGYTSASIRQGPKYTF